MGTLRGAPLFGAGQVQGHAPGRGTHAGCLAFLDEILMRPPLLMDVIATVGARGGLPFPFVSICVCFENTCHWFNAFEPASLMEEVTPKCGNLQ